MSDSFSLCVTCGVEHQHPLPEVCAICDDERQYLPEDGLQRWIAMAELKSAHRIEVSEIEPGLHALTPVPAVGIGHRPILAQTSEGNLLWDPPGYIDEAAIHHIHTLGGVRWIAASHPHMFGAQIEWSTAFNNAPVYVNSRDAEWVMRPGNAIREWDGEVELTPGLTLVRVGGHFPGSSVALWRGHDGEGVLLSGDSILPVARKGWVTFLRSYPNRLPLSAGAVRRIADRVLPLDFDRLYGNFPKPLITEDGKRAVQQSAEQHIAWMSGEFDHLT